VAPPPHAQSTPFPRERCSDRHAGCARAAGARRRTAGDELSDREREVGALIVDGLTHKQIGAKLYISPKTVEQHVARLRQKLDASNRAALVAALRHHLDDRRS
jgi:DNA-binding CsgD family transcriptional regulator